MGAPPKPQRVLFRRGVMFILMLILKLADKVASIVPFSCLLWSMLIVGGTRVMSCVEFPWFSMIFAVNSHEKLPTHHSKHLGNTRGMGIAALAPRSLVAWGECWCHMTVRKISCVEFLVVEKCTAFYAAPVSPRSPKKALHLRMALAAHDTTSNNQKQLQCHSECIEDICNKKHWKGSHFGWHWADSTHRDFSRTDRFLTRI